MTETFGMIQSKLPDLLRQKEYDEKRRISMRKLAEETDLAKGTIQRIMKGDMERVYMSTLETLCRYFNVGDINQLIQYVPDAQPADDGQAG